MTSLKRSDRRNRERMPAREEMDVDVSILARFEKVMQAVEPPAVAPALVGTIPYSPYRYAL